MYLKKGKCTSRNTSRPWDAPFAWVLVCGGFHNGAPLQIASSPRILQLEKVEKGISYMNIEH